MRENSRDPSCNEGQRLVPGERRNEVVRVLLWAACDIDITMGCGSGGAQSSITSPRWLSDQSCMVLFVPVWPGWTSFGLQTVMTLAAAAHMPIAMAKARGGHGRIAPSVRQQQYNTWAWGRIRLEFGGAKMFDIGACPSLHSV